MSSRRAYQGGTLEGLGGPVNAETYTLDGIDPTLDSCCQREVRDVIRHVSEGWVVGASDVGSDAKGTVDDTHASLSWV